MRPCQKRGAPFQEKKDPPQTGGGQEAHQTPQKTRRLLLPGALLMAVRLQALTALVFVHLEPTFLLQIAHKVKLFPHGTVRCFFPPVKQKLGTGRERSRPMARGEHDLTVNPRE